MMDPDWLPFHPAPSAPEFVVPDGAVDAHCHVFGPVAEFPFAPERKYTPAMRAKANYGSYVITWVSPAM